MVAKLWSLLLLACLVATAARTVEYGDYAPTMANWPVVSLVMVTDTSTTPYLMERAIAFARRQTYPNIELVIIDDNVVSRSDVIATDDLAWVRYEQCKRRTGVGVDVRWADNLAMALELARGSVIVQWDERDISLPNRVDAQVRMILEGDIGG
jgi:hypothetical protein